MQNEVPLASTSSSSRERNHRRDPQGRTKSPYTGIDLAETLAASTSGRPSTQPPVPPIRGVALGYDELVQSMVYDPSDVPVRHSKREIAEQLEALYSQYDNEDFDLGIKQFMIEQQIQADLEDGLDRKGGNEGFEEKLSQALFADEDGEQKDTIKDEDVAKDAFTTEVAEEYWTMFGEPGSLETAWRVQDTLHDLSYTQLWTLVGEGRVERVSFYGPEQRALLALLSQSAPGGQRTVKVCRVHLLNPKTLSWPLVLTQPRPQSYVVIFIPHPDPWPYSFTC